MVLHADSTGKLNCAVRKRVFRFGSWAAVGVHCRMISTTTQKVQLAGQGYMAQKPQKSFWQIWNMSFGFLGIQFGWGLQMANMSAIYEYLGARADQIPILWLAAPLTGLIVQPIIGHASDHTWTRLGRRRPYFLVGAILSSIALILMPRCVRAVDGCGPAVDSGLVDQHQHGAVPGVRRRPAAGGAAYRKASPCRACSSEWERWWRRRCRGC